MKMMHRIFTILLFSGFAVNSYGQTNDLVKFSERQKDKSLKILKKPTATGSLSCPKGLAVVKLSVTFHSSGKVTEVAVSESSTCAAFDKKAVKAAKKIQFEPEIKDGSPVTVVKFVQYSFRLLDKI